MKIEDYKKALSEHEGLPLTEYDIIYNDFEIYSMEEDKSAYFDSFEEALEYVIDGKTVREIIEGKDDIFQDNMGGRGTDARKTKGGGKLFGGKGARSGGKTVSGVKDLLPPAYINTLTSSKYKSVEGTAKAFGKSTLAEAREYATLIDEQGFALKYAKGQKTRVVHLEQKGAYSMHNHPSKALNKNAKGTTKYLNAPSTADLRNWALGKGRGTIVAASGNRTVYVMEKSNNFNGKAFTKAMSQAKSTGNYDKDVDKWLKKNQKGLNYKYKRIKF